MTRHRWGKIGAALLAVMFLVGSVQAASDPRVRIKDVARVKTDRINQLTGLGLVIGLEGTGDSQSAMANVQMVANMLANFGVTVPADRLRVRNVAAVMVTADLPPFARNGDALDVTVSSFGDAKSLQGGILLLTPLKGADGQVYAVAQGAVSIGGFNTKQGGNSVQKNHPTVGMVTGGATVEVELNTPVAENGMLVWVLRSPDFTTVSRMADVINRVFTPQTARAVDKGTVEVQIPESYRGRVVDFIAAVEELPVEPDAVARVVVNERTGTIVMGHDVRISTVAVSHGNLTVRIQSSEDVSQPLPFSNGSTVTTQSADIQAQEGSGSMTVLESGASIEDLVKALNAVGATPRDIIAILQAIKSAGALHGELIIE